MVKTAVTVLCAAVSLCSTSAALVNGYAGHVGSFTDDTTLACRWTSQEKKYDCSWKDLTAVPTDIPPETEVLALNNNKMATIPGGVFNALVNLKQLDLGSNLLTSVGTGLFANQAELEVMYLSNNKFVNIPATMFEGLANLKYLYLDHNEITTITSGGDTIKTKWRVTTTTTQTPTPAPTVLGAGAPNASTSVPVDSNVYNLVNATLMSTSPGAFDKLGGLQFLSMDYNHIVDLHNNTVVQTTATGMRLRRLLEVADFPTRFDSEPAERRLSTDQIATLYNYATATIPPTPVGFIPDVSQSHFEIEHVHQRGHFDKLANLNHLSIRHNNISHIPHDTFDKLANLDHLDLYSNRIAEIDVYTFRNLWNKLTKLQYLSLSNQVPTVQIVDRGWIDPVKDAHYAGLFLAGAQHGIGQGIQSGDW